MRFKAGAVEEVPRILRAHPRRARLARAEGDCRSEDEASGECPQEEKKKAADPKGGGRARRRVTHCCARCVQARLPPAVPGSGMRHALHVPGVLRGVRARLGMTEVIAAVIAVPVVIAEAIAVAEVVAVAAAVPAVA